MKSLIPVLLTVSLTLTLKGYLNMSISPDHVAVSSKVDVPSDSIVPVIVPVIDKTITPKLRSCDWQLVKTAVISPDKALDLASPRFLSDYPIGDVSWISNEGINSSLQSAKIQFLQLGIADIKRLNREGLDASWTASYPTAIALQNPLLLPSQIPANTLVAYQTEAGNYYLLKIKPVTWGTTKAIELSVYRAVS